MLNAQFAHKLWSFTATELHLLYNRKEQLGLDYSVYDPYKKYNSISEGMEAHFSLRDKK